MAKSIALAPNASRLASLLLSYMRAVCAFVAPRHPGASSAIIDRLSHSRALGEATASWATTPVSAVQATGTTGKQPYRLCLIGTSTAQDRRFRSSTEAASFTADRPRSPLVRVTQRAIRNCVVLLMVV